MVIVIVILELKLIGAEVLQVGHIEVVEEVLELGTFPLELDEELLRVRSGLGARPGLHV